MAALDSLSDILFFQWAASQTLARGPFLVRMVSCDDVSPAPFNELVSLRSAYRIEHCGWELAL